MGLTTKPDPDLGSGFVFPGSFKILRQWISRLTRTETNNLKLLPCFL
jgi:hypothetical protein